VLTKSDWLSVMIATFGVGIVMYYGWSARNENPVMKKILYTLLGFIFALWILCALVVFNV